MMTKAAGLLVFPLLFTPFSPIMKKSTETDVCADTIVYGTRDLGQQNAAGLAGFGPQAAHLAKAVKVDTSTKYVANRYVGSVDAGVQTMVKDLKDISTNCKTSDIIIVGYAQGAQIAKNALSSLEENSKEVANIEFILLIADPTRDKSEQHIIHLDNGGIAAQHGKYAPASNVNKNALSPLAGKTYSVCVATDSTCSRTANTPNPNGYLSASLTKTIARLSSLPQTRVLDDVAARELK